MDSRPAISEMQERTWVAIATKSIGADGMDCNQGVIDEQLPACLHRRNGCPIAGKPKRNAFAQRFLRAAVVGIAVLLAASVAPVNARPLAGTNSLGGQVTSDIQNRPGHAPVQDFKPPYPFTREQFWKKLLKIAALPNGYVTRSDVERIFGVTLKVIVKRSARGGISYAYGVRGGVDWYFDMGVEVKSATESDFNFRWGRPPGTPLDRFTGLPPLPAGMCITPDEMTTGFKSAGWQFVGLSPRKSWVGKGEWQAMPDFRRYHKDNRGMLYAEFWEGCLASIILSATDHPQY